MTNSDDSKQPLEAILEEYLTRLDNGEMPDTEEYIAQYPGWADKLRRFFDNLAFVDERLAAAGADSGRGESEPPSVEYPHVQGFRILGELGNGSQGIVYKAVQLGTNRLVALKLIREGTFASKAQRRRFENEVELASRLNHPGIAAVYSCGENAGRNYFAMEFVDGEPLDVYMSLRTLDVKSCVVFFLQICDAVGYAHQRGVIHRDIKPSNILIDLAEQVRIVDFGLARDTLAGPEQQKNPMTQVGEFAGTWYYASPEQVRRNPALIDVRADVYSLGVILYEMLTDCLPYPIRDVSREVIADHILETPPARPSGIRKGLDDDLDTIILRCLSKEPERRYQSVSELGVDLRRWMAGDAIEAKRDSSWYIFRRAVARHRWRVAVVTTVLLALVTFAAVVSVLYAQALTARATTDIRGQVVRQSQRFLIGSVDELNWAGNRLVDLADAYPDLPLIQALGKEPYEDTFTIFSTLAADIPDRLLDKVLDPDQPATGPVEEWLDSQGGGWERIVEASRKHRFVFKTEHFSQTDLALVDQLGPIGHARSVSKALVALGVHKYRHSSHEDAIAYLEAARSIAMDLADGRTLNDKIMSISARARLYDALLAIFEDVGSLAESAQPYIDFALRDLPLARYRHAMLAERHKRAQLLEASSVGDAKGDSAYIDLDLLNAHWGGIYKMIGQLNPEDRARARSISPLEALEVLDEWSAAPADWDLLSYAALNARSERLVVHLRAKRAFELCKPLLTGVRVAFQARGRVRTKRTATILTAYICRYRLNTGDWPEKPRDALPSTALNQATDPFIGTPFGYRRTNTSVTLYSFNEDGLDHDALVGIWGQAGTDVVFFHVEFE